jgi:hypothetical protein
MVGSSGADGRNERRNVGSRIARTAGGVLILIFGAFLAIVTGVLWMFGQADFTGGKGNTHPISNLVWIPAIIVIVLGLGAIFAPTVPKRAEPVRTSVMIISRSLLAILLGVPLVIFLILLILSVL